MKLTKIIDPLAEEFARTNGDTQAAFFNAFAHELFIACAADDTGTQRQLCDIGNHMSDDAKRLFRDMVEMFKKIEGGYGG